MIWSWPFGRRSSQSSSVVLLGKLPCQPDFVREGARGAAADAFDSFLVEATPPLHQSLGVERLPRLWFCQWLPKQPHGLVGVAAPSRDAAGRAFPVAVARGFEQSAFRAKLEQVFWQCQPFLDGAAALITRAAELSLEEVRSALTDLTDHDAGALQSDPHAPPAAAEWNGLFGSDLAVQSYALYTVAAAFAADQPGLTLDCPVRHAGDRSLWLALAGQISERLGNTTCALYTPHEPRLLLAIGGWNSSLLCAIAARDRSFDRVWPLTTESAAAREHAREEVLAALPELARSQTLPVSDLAGRLARFSKSLRS